MLEDFQNLTLWEISLYFKNQKSFTFSQEKESLRDVADVLTLRAAEYNVQGGKKPAQNSLRGRHA